MPRQARLDAPGTLHHVIIRGLERRAIVKDDVDREAFVTRLGAMAQATGTPIYGWALLPNHAHVLLRSGPTGLPRFMRRLLTGYAITFNRRHRRVGHLFQNRYKSIVVEEAPHVRELVRYIHLNPLRAQQARGHRLRRAQALIRQRCRREQVGLEELRMGSRRRRIAAVRARVVVYLVTRLGLSLAETARQLGVSTSGIAKAVARAERPSVH